MSHPTRLFAAVLALTLGWSFNASAQKTTTPIFYTDSDLKEKVGFVELKKYHFPAIHHIIFLTRK